MEGREGDPWPGCVSVPGTSNPQKPGTRSPVAGSYSHVRAGQIGRSSEQFSFQQGSQCREGRDGLLQPWPVDLRPSVKMGRKSAKLAILKSIQEMQKKF